MENREKRGKIKIAKTKQTESGYPANGKVPFYFFHNQLLFSLIVKMVKNEVGHSLCQVDVTTKVMKCFFFIK